MYSVRGMIWRFLNAIGRPVIFILLLSSPVSIAAAKGHGVEARTTAPRLTAALPGKIITGSILVFNHSARSETYSEELLLPPGWSLIEPRDSTFLLRPREEQARIYAFAVSQSAAAGNYKITYTVKSRRDYGVTDTETLSVVVLPMIKLFMMVEENPEQVIAGQSYRARVRLSNRGNIETKVRITLALTPEYPSRTDPAVMTLGAGKSQLVTITVQTDEQLRQKVTEILTIRAEASVTGSAPVLFEQALPTVVLPRVTGDPSAYHTLPAYLRLMTMGGDSGRGFQAEFSGSGSIDEDGKEKLEFLFRGPDRQSNTPVDLKDEYRVSYHGPLMELHLGDRSYSLSPLTDRYRYGRGAEADVRQGGAEAGVFSLKTRWENPEQTETGAHAGYAFSDSFGLRGNILTRNDGASMATVRLTSLQARATFDKAADLDMEYGEDGKRATAYRINLNGHLPQDSWYEVEKIRAEPGYDGYYTDSDLTSAIVTIPLPGNIRWNLSYLSYQDNLNLDPAVKDTANKERTRKTGFFLPFFGGTDLSLEYEDFRREDRLEPVNYAFEEKVLIAGLGRTFRKFVILATVEGEEFATINAPENGKKRSESYGFNAVLNPLNGLSLTLYGRSGQERYLENPDRVKSAGASASLRVNETFSASASYSVTNYDSSAKKRQDNSSSSIAYTFPNRHSLTLTSSWAKTEGSGEEASFMLLYTIPLYIPMTRKKSVGMIRGRITDKEKEGMPVPNVVLSAGQATAVTDKNGEFVFPALKPGRYYLKEEKGSIGLNRATTESTPLPVEVTGGKIENILISVVTTGGLTGRIEVYDFISSESDELKTACKGNNILVEISRGKEVLRRITDDQGKFSFEDVRPGTWTVKFYSDDLPLHHYLETEQLLVEVPPGKEQKIFTRVLPKRRHIQFIDEGKV
jgi:protocatechuate 3,4-dioxygenase beta subunit